MCSFAEVQAMWVAFIIMVEVLLMVCQAVTYLSSIRSAPRSAPNSRPNKHVKLKSTYKERKMSDNELDKYSVSEFEGKDVSASNGIRYEAIALHDVADSVAISSGMLGNWEPATLMTGQVMPSQTFTTTSTAAQTGRLTIEDLQRVRQQMENNQLLSQQEQYQMFVNSHQAQNFLRGQHEQV